jgi:glycogen debranching enzyme
MQTVKKLMDRLPRPTEAYIIPTLALRSVTSKSGKGVYASSDTLFRGAVFGRDSLEVAEDIMLIKPRLVQNILLTLAGLQGLTYNEANEEEPGKIFHEYRSIVVDGKRIDTTSMEIFHKLATRWGGSDHEMVYYGSVDATPHFLRVLGMYAHHYGNKILDRRVQQRDGRIVTLRDVAAACTTWLIAKLSESHSGLLEYQKRNPHGLNNQVWKDSDEFYVHENKMPANHDAPIASIEVQGLAYDALMAAATFFPELAKEYTARATALRDRTIELLWQPDRNSFALGTDYDPAGHLRIIRTPTANPAELLDTSFFDSLPEDDKQTYIAAIVTSVMSKDFLTDAGVRSRSLSAAHLVDFWDYHGSYVTWPKETHDIATGLRRQGFTELSRQLGNRILNVFLKSRQYAEFVYIDEQGRVFASTPSTHSHGDIILVDSTIKPEIIQAWTVSAILATISRRLGDALKIKLKQPPKQPSWQEPLERSILTNMHKVEVYINPFALSARYPEYQYRLVSRNSE